MQLSFVESCFKQEVPCVLMVISVIYERGDFISRIYFSYLIHVYIFSMIFLSTVNIQYLIFFQSLNFLYKHTPIQVPLLSCQCENHYVHNIYISKG